MCYKFFATVQSIQADSEQATARLLLITQQSVQLHSLSDGRSFIYGVQRLLEEGLEVGVTHLLLCVTLCGYCVCSVYGGRGGGGGGREKGILCNKGFFQGRLENFLPPLGEFKVNFQTRL